MTWGRIDDNLHGHPKFRALPHRHRAGAMGCWVIMLSCCAHLRNNGRVEAHMPAELGFTKAHVQALVDAGMWDVHPAGGWQFHNWEKYNKTPQQLAATREATRGRVAKHRRNRADSAASDADVPVESPQVPVESPQVPVESPQVPGTYPEPDALAPILTSDDADGNAVTGNAVQLPQPCPALPVLPSEELPNPAQPSPGAGAAHPRDRAGAFVAADPAIAGASGRWQRDPELLAKEANEIGQRIASEHGADLAHEIVRQALIDTTTRSLRRLDTARVPGYLPDLARAAKSEMRREQGRPRGRPVELPACDHCGARKGAPEHERTLTDLDGRLLGRCTECLPGTAA